MKVKFNTHVLTFLQLFVKAAGIFSISIGGIVLAGWFLNIIFLQSILPNAATMKFNTALCFFLAGISLWLLKNKEGRLVEKRIGQTAAGLVVFISVLTIGEYLFGWELGIDQIVVKDLATLPANFPGRMSQITAICFTLSGLALLLIETKASQYFSLSVILLALLAVIGYLFNYQALYQLGGYGTVALHTALTFLILSLAVFAARPLHGLMKMSIGDMAGSRAIRLLIPFTVILTILLGWLVEQGELLEILNPGNKVAVLVILLIIIYSPLIYLYAGRLNQADAQVIRLNRMYATLSHVNQTIVRVRDRQELFESVCRTAVEFGEFNLAWIGLLDETSGEFQPVVMHGQNTDQWPPSIVNTDKASFENGVIANAVRTSKVVTSEDIQTSKSTNGRQNLLQNYGYHSSAAIPFHLQGSTIGALILVSSEKSLFKSHEEIRLLEEMRLDISHALENIEAEQAKSYLAAIIKTSNDAIIAKNLEGIVTSWNITAEKIFGYSADEMISQPILQLIPPDRLQEEEQIISQIKQDQPVSNFETVRITKAGTHIDMSITVSPVRDAQGRVIGASKIARDITQRKQAEEKIQTQLQHLKALRAIDTAISSSFDINVTLDVILQQVRAQLSVDAAAILLLDPHEQSITYAASRGFHSEAIRQSRVQAGEGIVGRAVLERRAIYLSNLQDSASQLVRTGLLAEENLWSIIVCRSSLKTRSRGRWRSIIAPA